MTGSLSRRVALLEQRMGGVSYDSWTDCQLVERMNEICEIFQATGFHAPLLDPACPDPAMLDGFMAKAKAAIAVRV